MRHPIFSLLPTPSPSPTTTSTTIAMPSSSSSSLSSSTKPRKPSSSATANHHHSPPPLLCRHHSSASATATLDLLILILVLFSGTFLLTSYFSYLFHSLSLLLSLSLSSSPSFVYLLGFSLSFAAATAAVFCCCCSSSSFFFRSRRKCGNPKCKGLKKALEFDLQLQTEDSLKSGTVNDLDKLPWKGGTESNPDYECLRAELRKMAPPNGRAVLLFRNKCGCPVAKLVGWGPKKGRKHKKFLANVAANGDHR